MRIDCDAHVDETEATWEYLEEGESRFRPVLLDSASQAKFAYVQGLTSGDNRPHRIWLLADGTVRLRRFREDKKQGTTEGTRTLTDIDERLRHMDEMGIDVQVLYRPSFFASPVSAVPELEVALCRAYNRWIGNATEKSHGRLRWVAIPPLLSMERAVDELRWAKDHGACGVMKKGFEHGRAASDPYFFPLYEEASRLDLPICIHTGFGDPDRRSGFGGTANAISAFTDLARAKVPDRFPDLRVGWIETGASWVPYLCHELFDRPAVAGAMDQDFLRRNRFYVACEPTDDLPYILKFGTEDCLMVGTDYGHNDRSTDLRALGEIEEQGERGEIPASVARKIVDDNPRRFYGL